MQAWIGVRRLTNPDTLFNLPAPSGRVDRMYRRAILRTARHLIRCEPFDDSKHASVTVWAAVIDGRLLLAGQDCNQVKRAGGSGQVLAAQGKCGSTIAVGQETEVANLHEAGR